MITVLPGMVNIADTPLVNSVAEPVSIGYVVMGVILGPVIILTLMAVFGHPRTFRVPALFLVSLALLIGAMISSFAVLGFILRFFIPQ